MTELLNLLFGFLRSFVRRDTALLLENLVLRHQLQVVLRSNPRPRLRNRDRILWVWIRRFCPGSWQRHLVVVRPETVIRWHRRGWRLYWTWRSRARFGRPRLTPEVRALIARMAFENPTWGTQRIRGELLKLGITVSARSIRRYRTRTSNRPPTQTWRTFLGNQAKGIWAADLLVVQTIGFRTLYVLFFVSHARRELISLNVTASPTAAWVWQQLINATPWNRRPIHLIHDRDNAYGKDFDTRLAALGVIGIRTPYRAPKANAIAERLVGTLRRECLDHIIVLNEEHLVRILREFAAYYNLDRPHRTLAHSPPIRPNVTGPSLRGAIVSRPVLGGLHHVYSRAA
jgi:transposase InsO family protein